MKLIGNYLSPYTRRVAISLTALEIPFEIDLLSPFNRPGPVREHNPLIRIPTLVLDNGEALFESHVILDAIDQIVGPKRSLTPCQGKKRRQVMKVTAVGTGSCDKAVWALYEGRFHPPEKIHQPWIDHNESQVLSGLSFLNKIAEPIVNRGWMAGTKSMSQADITSVVAFSFVNAVRPNLEVTERVPFLAKFADRCEAMDIFRATPVPKSLPS